MKPTLCIISGWAHGLDSIRPLGDALANQFDVNLLSGAQVLSEKHIPQSDIIIGGSMGGLLAMDYLPEGCKKLILISSTAKFCAADNYPCGIAEKALRRMILQLKRSPEAVLDAFYKNVFHPHPAQKVDPGCTQEELIAGLEYLLFSDVRKKVPTLGRSVLLLHGLEDLIIPAAASEWLCDHLPEAQLALFENAGHALPTETILPVIHKFLS